MSAALVVVAEVLLGLAGLLAGLRVLRGPTVADRVVALEVLAVVALGAVACEALEGPVVLLDVALVAAVVTFVGTVAFALALGRGEGP